MLPESLTLGQRTLEDVFLELTGRELAREPRPPPAAFAPRPGAAPLHRMVLAQAGMESRLMLRNGEQLLLAVVIPVIVLVGAVDGAAHVDLDLAHPAVDVLHPGRAGPGRDVDGVHLAGDRDRVRAPLRRDQAAGLLAAAPLRPAEGKIGGLLLSRCSRSW